MVTKMTRDKRAMLETAIAVYAADLGKLKGYMAAYRNPDADIVKRTQYEETEEQIDIAIQGWQHEAECPSLLSRKQRASLASKIRIHLDRTRADTAQQDMTDEQILGIAEDELAPYAAGLYAITDDDVLRFARAITKLPAKEMI